MAALNLFEKLLGFIAIAWIIISITLFLILPIINTITQ